MTAVRMNGLIRVALAIGAALLAPGCGGGSPSSSSYPAVQGTYGSFHGTTQGYVRQYWTAADGTVTAQLCNAVITIPTQNGTRFEGNVLRLEPCSTRATFVGEVDHAGAIRFTLTQARWRNCAGPDTVEYAGNVMQGNLTATGHLTVQCDDGRSMAVEEQIVGSLTEPPTTPG